MTKKRLAVVETHPVQYHAPVYRTLAQELGIAVTALYGSDFSVAGYRDEEFGATFQWDTDLLSGYDSRFLSNIATGGARTYDKATTRGLGEQLKAVNPDVVMLMGYSPRFQRDAFFTAWHAGYPLLFRGETTDHAVARSPVKDRARSLALRLLYARFAALLYVGSYSRAHLVRLGVPASRLFFSPYCVDTTPFRLDDASRVTLRTMTRAEWNIGAHEIVVLFSGKLVARKAPEQLLCAAQKFASAQEQNLVLMFVGDGEMRADLTRQANETPRVRTCFAGFQNQTQLSGFFHAADLFALPSRVGETWGLVVNEALHHGLPCVVSDRVGCAPDLVTRRETGEIFRADDVDDLVRALKRVQPLLGRAEIRALCIARAEQYSTRRAAQGIAHAVDAVLRGL